MRVNINGVYRDATTEEEEEFLLMQKDNVQPVTETEQRMNEIEAAIIELAAMLTGGGL